jgi:ornithine cyclodeaminase
MLDGNEKKVVDIVEAAYHLHGHGATVNPPSYFLRFPDRPTSRIIALPASIGGEVNVDGLKWISSFPENVSHGVPRASAVLILNDHVTGYPIACLESSIISAARTAASAALAAAKLSAARGNGTRPRRVGFIGTGLIARYLHTYLARTGWDFDEIGVHDLDAKSASGFRDYIEGEGGTGRITVHGNPGSLIRSSDLVVLATVAGAPYLDEIEWFSHDPLVLNVSLRDLSPEIILNSTNIVDDVEHCLKANTSPHLAEQMVGHRDFLSGTLFDVLEGRVDLPADRPLVFSPFGLGVLDLAVAKHIYDEVSGSGELNVIDDFFHEVDRHVKAKN